MLCAGIDKMEEPTSKSMFRIFLWKVSFFSLVMLQHIAIYADSIPSTVLVIPVLIFWVVKTGVCKVDATLFGYYASMVFVGAASLVLNHSSAQVSFSSLVYLVFLMFPFVLRVKNTHPRRLQLSKEFWLAYRSFMIICSAVGIFQLALLENFVSFRDLIPEGFVINGYNTTNAIVYGESMMRANGFFFYEPSFFSQFVAVAIIVEFAINRSLPVMLLYMAAMAASFSGTGIMLLCLGAVLVVSSAASFKVFARLCVPILLFVVASIYINPEYFLGRLLEFGEENSSAYVRFISPALYVYDVFTSGVQGALFGVGPGMASLVREANVMADFPGLGKVMYEYGLLGLITIGGLYFAFVRRSCSVRWFSACVLFFQLVLSNGVLQPATIIFFLLFVWFGGPALNRVSNSSKLI